jgi:tetratricopeptide (TPR) repeat protein
MPTFDKSYIIQYVENELPADEMQAFEAELQRNPMLAAETARCRELLNELEQRLQPDAGVEALKATLRVTSGRYFGQAPARSTAKVRPMARYVMGIAAGLVLILAGLWFFRANRPTLDELGRTEMITSLERGNRSDSVLQEAAGQFNAGQFDRALPLLDQALRVDSASQLARFYRGVTLWHRQRLPEARADLQIVYAGGSALQYEAAFYLALSYAQEKDSASAVEWLRRIPDEAPVATKADQLAKFLQPAR